MVQREAIKKGTGLWDQGAMGLGKTGMDKGGVGWGAGGDGAAGLLDSATGEASLEDPLLAPTVKAQQPVTPALLVPLTAPPPLCLSLHTHTTRCLFMEKMVMVITVDVA